MPILCGTDFSHSGGHAVRAAACLARLRREDLCLAHVLDLPLAFPPLGDLEIDAASAQMELMRVARAHAAERLAEDAARIATGGVRVSTELRVGHADHALLELAEELGASSTVIGATGLRPSSSWKLGSHADRIAQTARGPVLVVRDAQPFEAWASGERALRVLVALDRSPTCEVAVRWTEELTRLGRTTLLAAHVYWPPDEARRAELAGGGATKKTGLAPTIALGVHHPDLDRELAREFVQWLERIPGGSALELRFVGGLGRPADHLVEIATDEAVDLVVVGSHQRGGLSRFWHGSVSRGVIDLAPMNVACIPTSPVGTRSG